MPRRYSDDPSNLDRGFRERKDERPDPEDRDKKSWREKDRAKDRSSHRSEQGTKSSSQPRPESQAYRSYKSQLDKVFSGGGLPDSLKEKMDAAGIGAGKKKQAAAAKEIADAKSPRAKVKALTAYKSEYGFPTDEEVLAGLLDLDDEPEIVREALETLESLHEEGQLKKAKSLSARIKTVKMMVDDDDVFAAADRLLKKL